MHVEDGEYEPKELPPPPDDESLPQQIDQVALFGVLVARCEYCDDPRYNITL